MRHALTKGILLLFCLIGIAAGFAFALELLPTDSEIERGLLGYGMILVGSFLFFLVLRLRRPPGRG